MTTAVSKVGVIIEFMQMPWSFKLISALEFRIASAVICVTVSSSAFTPARSQLMWKGIGSHISSSISDDES